MFQNVELIHNEYKFEIIQEVNRSSSQKLSRLALYISSLPQLETNWCPGSWALARLALLPHSSTEWQREALGGSRLSPASPTASFP